LPVEWGMNLMIGIYFLLSAYMCGLIWFVQVVHYPLFRQVGPDVFGVYEQMHTRLTTWVVAPVMVAELGLGIWLCFSYLDIWWWMQLGLMGVLWISTFFIQVPLHAKLSEGYSSPVARKLVRTNWIRTVGWSLKALLLLVWLVFSLYN